MEYVKKTTMFFLRFTSLAFIVFISIYSVSQNKCEKTFGFTRYTLSVSMWEMRIKRLSSDLDRISEVLFRLRQIMTRLDGILENSTAQLDVESVKASEKTIKV